MPGRAGPALRAAAVAAVPSAIVTHREQRVSAPQTADAAPTLGAVLVRLPVEDGAWATALPPVPDGWTLTVSLGHPSLLPIPEDELTSRGYAVVGIATARAPVGRSVDVLVPGALQAAEPRWWEQLGCRASRVFDLRMGPVLAVLGNQLALHEQGPATLADPGVASPGE
jgi:hypothetical protein